MILRDNRVKFLQNSIIEKFKPYKDYLSNYEEFISAVKSTNTLEEVLEFNQLRFHLSYLTFQKLLDSRLSDYDLTLNDFVKFTENNLELTEKEWVEIREQARREVALESSPEYQLKLAKETLTDETAKKFASAVGESTTEADSLLLNMLSLHINNCKEQGLIDETVQGEDIEDVVDFTQSDEHDGVSDEYEEELVEELGEAKLDFSFLESDPDELDEDGLDENLDDDLDFGSGDTGLDENLDNEDLDFSSDELTDELYEDEADENLDDEDLDFSSEDTEVDENEYLVESGVDFTEDDGLFETEEDDLENDFETSEDFEDENEDFEDSEDDLGTNFETSEDFEDENEDFEDFEDENEDFEDSDNDFETNFETSEDFEDENEDFEDSDNDFSEESNEDWDFDQAEDVYRSNVGLYGGSGGYDSAGLSQKEILLGEERKREKKPLSQETIFLQRQQRDELADERAEKAQEALNLAIKLVDAPKKLASLFGSKRKKR